MACMSRVAKKLSLMRSVRQFSCLSVDVVIAYITSTQGPVIRKSILLIKYIHVTLFERKNSSKCVFDQNPIN